MSFNIGRYEILGEIGRGAMATVYKAFDPRIKRELAIKILRPEHCVNQDFRNRFLRETKAVGKLNHPNIVKIYDVGEYNDQPYIAMELLTGQFLDKSIEQRRFSVEETRQVGIQLASALERAHGFGVIHRDIKPANIAWSEKNQQVKLTDFGIARIESLEATQSTIQGQVIGTPKYMSPEQILGKHVDARTDLFSLGVVLYQLVTGCKPFTGDTLASLTYQIAHQAPDPINKTVKTAPEGFCRIIDSMLEKDTDKRVQSASELLQRFQQFKLQTPPPQHDSKNSRLLTMAVVTVAVLAVGIGLISLFKNQSDEPQIVDRSKTTTGTQSRKPEAQVISGLDPVMQNKIEQNLIQFECAALSSRADENNAVLIKGHISHEEDLLTLMDMMDSIPGLSNVTYDVKALSWPFCEVASILSEDIQTNVVPNRGLHIETRSHNPNLYEGNHLDLELLTPDFESYVYVDYFRSDGTVVHLYPDNALKSRKHAPLKSIKLNSGPNQWKIQKPFGDNQIVVMASNVPLLSRKRPTKENAQDYLSELYHQVVTKQKQLTAKFLAVTTGPKS